MGQIRFLVSKWNDDGALGEIGVSIFLWRSGHVPFHPLNKIERKNNDAQGQKHYFWFIG